MRQRGPWYEAECPELGIVITTKSLESAKEIADRAARARGISGVVLVESARPSGLFDRVGGLPVDRGARETRSTAGAR